MKQRSRFGWFSLACVIPLFSASPVSAGSIADETSLKTTLCELRLTFGMNLPDFCRSTKPTTQRHPLGLIVVTTEKEAPCDCESQASDASQRDKALNSPFKRGKS